MEIASQKTHAHTRCTDRYFRDHWLGLSDYFQNTYGNISLDTPMFTTNRYFFLYFVVPIYWYLYVCVSKCTCLWMYVCISTVCCNLILYGFTTSQWRFKVNCPCMRHEMLAIRHTIDLVCTCNFTINLLCSIYIGYVF